MRNFFDEIPSSASPLPAFFATHDNWSRSDCNDGILAPCHRTFTILAYLNSRGLRDLRPGNLWHTLSNRRLSGFSRKIRAEYGLYGTEYTLTRAAKRRWRS